MAELDDDVRARVGEHLAHVQMLVCHGLKTIEGQQGEAARMGYREAERAVREFEHMLARQARDLDQRLRELGTRPAPAGPAAAVMSAKVPAGAPAPTVGTEGSSRALDDDYGFLRELSMAYMDLYADCRQLGDEQTARLADRWYRETAGLVGELERLAPGLVRGERAMPTGEAGGRRGSGTPGG